MGREKLIDHEGRDVGKTALFMGILSLLPLLSIPLLFIDVRMVLLIYCFLIVASPFFAIAALFHGTIGIIGAVRGDKTRKQLVMSILGVVLGLMTGGILILMMCLGD
ncbi:MAG: hypothetical protein ACYTHM_21985 [Planctomycetota bacterium]|jgi:hypothetical protein